MSADSMMGLPRALMMLRRAIDMSPLCSFAIESNRVFKVASSMVCSASDVRLVSKNP